MPERGVMVKAAYLCVPPLGGLRTLFRHLRRGLAEHGIQLDWLGAGQHHHELAVAWGLCAPGAEGLVVAPQTQDEAACGRALLAHLLQQQVQVVLLNAVADAVTSGLAFHLPEFIRRILLVQNTTPMTYRVARALRETTHYAVTPSPKVQSDLVRHHGFAVDRAVLIPNALDLKPYRDQPRRLSDGHVLRTLFLGRVEDEAKGVLWLPRILRGALSRGADVRLTVAGDGPDLEQLRAEVSSRGLEAHVDFLGAVPVSEVPALAARHDVLLMPSRFEGFGFTLAEAMAAGCVPVASALRGVTDFVVAHGRTGLLFPVGSIRAAAEQVARLDADRELLAAMSAAAREEVRARFTLATQAAAYAQLIHQVLEKPPATAVPLPLAAWGVPRGFQPGWWHRLPRPVKNVLRVWRERIRLHWGTV